MNIGQFINYLQKEIEEHQETLKNYPCADYSNNVFVRCEVYKQVLKRAEQISDTTKCELISRTSETGFKNDYKCSNCNAFLCGARIKRGVK